MLTFPLGMAEQTCKRAWVAAWSLWQRTINAARREQAYYTGTLCRRSSKGVGARPSIPSCGVLWVAGCLHEPVPSRLEAALTMGCVAEVLLEASNVYQHVGGTLSQGCIRR